ncbi:hypothetical protein M316_0062 [Nitrincola phage 1M3-16]|uniref:hypothetical protein n=1 Tax=Nitrincola phage 1M3-16 TaxID=1472912 RepID=UPI000444BE15|nr:hypothetical protein GJ22_gp090 [Nitrincola phage 1M3-16]AHX01127.1 hypothetical protein M316_0062 [Nitrincola phage 1M3-16]
MNLISCNSCAIVLDASKMKFPDPCGSSGDELYPDNEYAWDGDYFIPYVNCPCCGTPILEPNLL